MGSLDAQLSCLLVLKRDRLPLQRPKFFAAIQAIKPTFSQIGHEFDGPREFFAKKKGVLLSGGRAFARLARPPRAQRADKLCQGNRAGHRDDVSADLQARMGLRREGRALGAIRGSLIKKDTG